MKHVYQIAKAVQFINSRFIFYYTLVYNMGGALTCSAFKNFKGHRALPSFYCANLRGSLKLKRCEINCGIRLLAQMGLNDTFVRFYGAPISNPKLECPVRKKLKCRIIHIGLCLAFCILHAGICFQYKISYVFAALLASDAIFFQSEGKNS